VLTGVGRLVERHRGFAFDEKDIEILSQENRYRLPHGSDDPAFHIGHRIDNAEGPVLKDGIGVQNEESGFHGGR
jgi:hypothetical protein